MRFFGNNCDVFKIVFPTSNGVVVQSGGKKVISVTNCDGQKKLRSFLDKNKVVFWHFPFIRGFQYFFCGIFGQLSALILALDLCGAPKVKQSELKKYYIKKLINLVLVCVVAVVFAGIGLGYLPGKLGYFIVGYSGSKILRNVVIMLLKIAIFYIFLLFLRIFFPVCEFFRFNRASDIGFYLTGKRGFASAGVKKFVGEIKVVSSAKRVFEAGKKKSVSAGSKDVDNGKVNLGSAVRKKLKKCPPRPLNFLNYLIFVFVLDFTVVSLCGASFGFWFNIVFHIAVLLVCMSVAYEVLYLLEICKVGWIKKLVYLTGVLVYAKPSTTHLETVDIAFTEINLLESQKERGFMSEENHAFSVVYNEVRNKLASAGVNDKSDADWLIATVLGKNRAEIKLVSSVSEKQYQDIMKATTRRMKGESLDNIFGFTEFYGLRFEVNKKVLTPRMETEILVEQVLKSAKNFKKPKILDVGTGSGAIAVSIAKNCDAEVTALDVSKPALSVAEVNAQKNGVKIEFLHSDLFNGLKKKQKFDIIVSNPPYIASGDIKNLDKNVRECDPLLALDGGEDGLDFYRAIIQKATKHLTAGGLIFFEIGKGQAKDVRKFLREGGFDEIKTIKDYNKIERVICGKFK